MSYRTPYQMFCDRLALVIEYGFAIAGVSFLIYIWAIA